MTERNIEILVHITAPCKASDDTRYRALASAYLDFEPQRTVDILPHQVPDSPDVLVSPQASFRSVWDNAGSPGLAGRIQQGEQSEQVGHIEQIEHIGLIGHIEHIEHIEHQPSVQPVTPVALHNEDRLHDSSWLAPPSEVPDSMPHNDFAVAAFNTPTRLLHYFLQSIEEDPSDPSAEHAARRVLQDDYHLSRTDWFDDTCLTEPPPAHHQQHAPASARRTPKTAGLDQATAEDRVRVACVVADTTPLGVVQPSRPSRASSAGPAFIPRTPLSARPGSEPPSSQRQQRTPVGGRVGRRPCLRGLRMGEACLASAAGRDRFSSAPAVDWTAETQIVSCEPAVANHVLGPRAPQHLARLAAVMEMGSRYRPDYVAREIRPFERGYWQMRLDGWAFKDKLTAWGFLGNYIRRDNNAGWGTRACRDPSWAWIRLYGWEHLAGELYILLYVASYRRLKFMEMKYYDGAGDVLVLVAARACWPALD